MKANPGGWEGKKRKRKEKKEEKHKPSLLGWEEI
jgi:hypothetical protein